MSSRRQMDAAVCEVRKMTDRLRWCDGCHALTLDPLLYVFRVDRRVHLNYHEPWHFRDSEFKVLCPNCYRALGDPDIWVPVCDDYDCTHGKNTSLCRDQLSRIERHLEGKHDRF